MSSLRMKKIHSHQERRSIPPAVNPIRLQRTPATVADQAGAERVAAAKLKECHESFQLKYDIDRSAPWWKKLYFWCVYLPFARFSFFTVGIVPMDHVRCRRCQTAIGEGVQLGWLERQSVWSEQWRALQDAERYPFGGVQRLPFNITEQEETCAPASQFPNSTASEKYERLDAETVPIDQTKLARLSRKLLETDPVVNRYRPKSV